MQDDATSYWVSAKKKKRREKYFSLNLYFSWGRPYCFWEIIFATSKFRMKNEGIVSCMLLLLPSSIPFYFLWNCSITVNICNALQVNPSFHFVGVRSFSPFGMETNSNLKNRILWSFFNSRSFHYLVMSSKVVSWNNISFASPAWALSVIWTRYGLSCAGRALVNTDQAVFWDCCCHFAGIISWSITAFAFTKSNRERCWFRTSYLNKQQRPLFFRGFENGRCSLVVLLFVHNF